MGKYNQIASMHKEKTTLSVSFENMYE